MTDSGKKPTRAQRSKRRSAIIAQLSDLSRDGWSNAKPYDYEPLEAELRALERS